ncbi:MAG: phosphotransferase [Marinosulfonomonas sp.]|nr:phosphotransferase [Marinosulfonomonas sp.]
MRSELITAGYLGAAGPWQPLSGGRTNHIWRICDGPNAIVCKLYDSIGGTDLFPNSPQDEALALQALTESHIAPEFIGALSVSAGTCLLYRFVTGEPASASLASVAAVLKELHAISPPAELRKTGIGSDAILGQGDDILVKCYGARKDLLMALRPRSVATNNVRSVFLHGDPVPQNIILAPHGAVLVDWQCPAQGDPCEDLATFLSPAMQTLYGHGPLSTKQRQQFVAAYDAPEVTDRLDQLQSHFNWRMAAHCLWKVENCEPDYEQGFALQMAELQKV